MAASQKRASKKRQQANRQPLMIAVVLLILVAAALGLFWLTRNESVYVADKQQTRQRVVAVMAAVNAPGTLVYEHLEDRGCSDDTSVGLATRVGCAFRGYKIYKGNGDVTSDLNAVEEALTRYGLKRNFGRFFDGKARGETGELVVDLPSYIAPSGEKDPIIGELISDEKVAAPVDGEYLYGVSAGAAYYYCSNDSWLKQPCPQPPSEPR